MTAPSSVPFTITPDIIFNASQPVVRMSVVEMMYGQGQITQDAYEFLRGQAYSEGSTSEQMHFNIGSSLDNKRGPGIPHERETGLPKLRKFKCTFCERTFCHGKPLVNHVRLKHSPRTFSQPDATFATAQLPIRQAPWGDSQVNAIQYGALRHSTSSTDQLNYHTRTELAPHSAFYNNSTPLLPQNQSFVYPATQNTAFISPRTYQLDLETSPEFGRSETNSNRYVGA